VIGGLKAVVVTEAVDTVFLLTGTISVTLFSIAALPQRGIHTWDGFRQFSALPPGD
jgi:solute:Na+ symporter, SSS family